MERENDFSQGSIAKNILNLAVPMTLAQLINVLYSVVDRVYIGHLQGVSANALTGIGLALPIITIITAFANLFGMGGAPLCSIARGSHEEEKAEKVMGNSFSMLLFTGVLLMGICFIFRKPLLYLFGASSATFPYANAYISIYLCGTVFVMISLGMNQFINSQGFGKIGMLTVMLGAFTNIVLDPILIFGLDMGVQGAALATVISQGLSAAWVMKYEEITSVKQQLLKNRPGKDTSYLHQNSMVIYVLDVAMEQGISLQHLNIKDGHITVDGIGVSDEACRKFIASLQQRLIGLECHGTVKADKEMYTFHMEGSRGEHNSSSREDSSRGNSVGHNH